MLYKERTKRYARFVLFCFERRVFWGMKGEKKDRDFFWFSFFFFLAQGKGGKNREGGGWEEDLK